MSERIGNLISSELRDKLKEIGRKGDIWEHFLEKAGGDPKIADFLADMNGIEDLGNLPVKERPLLKVSSPRVAAQKHASSRQG